MFLKFFDIKDSVSFFFCFKNILIIFNDNVYVVISNVYNVFMGILWFFFFIVKIRNIIWIFINMNILLSEYC